MNTQSLKPLVWSVRRELWENRFITVAPLIVAVIALSAFLYYASSLPQIMEKIATVEPGLRRARLTFPYDAVAVLLIIVQVLAGWFYCLDALHGERRDRSILFWKSLPVSDAVTVMSKACIPLVVLPMFTFVVILTTHILMDLASVAILLANGQSPGTAWVQWPFMRNAWCLFYGLVVHALWYAPIYAWLLLVSAWAQRATFLWAVLPPVVAVVIERFVLGTTWLGSLLEHRLGGSFEEAFKVPPFKGKPASPEQWLPHDPVPDPMMFLSSPGLWSGLAFAAVFFVLAILLRRSRDPM